MQNISSAQEIPCNSSYKLFDCYRGKWASVVAECAALLGGPHGRPRAPKQARERAESRPKCTANLGSRSGQGPEHGKDQSSPCKVAWRITPSTGERRVDFRVDPPLSGNVPDQHSAEKEEGATPPSEDRRRRAVTNGGRRTAVGGPRTSNGAVGGGIDAVTGGPGAPHRLRRRDRHRTGGPGSPACRVKAGLSPKSVGLTRQSD